MEALQLDLRACAEVHEECYRPSCAAQVPKSLVMLPFGQLGERLTLDDDIANRRLHHHVHFEEGFHGLTFVQGMVLEFLVGGESGLGQLGAQRLLVDVLRETGSELFVHLKDATDDAIACFGQLTLLRFGNHMYNCFVLHYGLFLNHKGTIISMNMCGFCWRHEAGGVLQQPVRSGSLLCERTANPTSRRSLEP